ncbi:hypothetical protein LJR235_005150 [Pararhizobium sp. LjRoot235]|uniref:hypothetical protein n=1 Tax=Pararhizobium sp. LjRoot235 TaxID=3342291 RepID=UPI003ECCEA85
MSRNPVRSKRPQATSPQSAAQGNPAGDAIIDQALALYGSDAATAVAYCGLDAWFEGEEVEFRRLRDCFGGSVTKYEAHGRGSTALAAELISVRG